MENKGRILNTRVKLRVDTNHRWELSSSTPLLEGEIGIGYDVDWNRTLRTYEKSNFKIKIGKSSLDAEGNPTSLSSHWNDAADLRIVLTDAQKEDLLSSIMPQLSTQFVFKTDYDQAMTEINSRLTTIESRLSSRVAAWVQDDSLYLSEGDKFVIS